MNLDDETVNDDGDVLVPNQPESSTDLACEICGTPLVYAGTGRKPKRCAEHKSSKSSSVGSGAGRAGSGRSSGSVEQAVATLGNLYDLIGMAFFLATPEAASLWSSNVTDLQTRNRAILSGDPELTKSINRLGVKGGKFAFAAVQISAVTPPAMVAAGALRVRAAERDARTRRETMRKTNGPQQNPGTDGPDLGTNRSFFG